MAGSSSKFVHPTPVGIRKTRQVRSGDKIQYRLGWYEQHCKRCCNRRCGTKDPCRGTSRARGVLSIGSAEHESCQKCGTVFSQT